MSEPETCPGCDGTIARAVQQGREITTFEHCQRCREQADRLFVKLTDAIIARDPFVDSDGDPRPVAFMAKYIDD